MKSLRTLFEQLEKESDYYIYFKNKLKEYGVNSPNELNDEDKRKFFDDVDAGWKSKKEEKF